MNATSRSENNDTRAKKARRIYRKLHRLFPDPKMALHYSNNWELLVAVILSAQCTDKKVNEVTKDLFAKYRTLDDYAEADRNEFESDIYSTGFYKNKTKNIIAAAQMVRDRFNSELPKTMEEMIAIPGVSRKTANVVLGNAYGIVEGVAVDTHVTRLSQLFGLTEHTDPDKIEKDLMDLLPRSKWFTFTYLMIEYGRHYCPARAHQRPDHTCPLMEEMVTSPDASKE